MARSFSLSPTSKVRTGLPSSRCFTSRSHSGIASFSIGSLPLAALRALSRRLLDRVEVLQAQLGVDGRDVGERVDLVLDVDHVVVVEAAHDVRHRVDLTDVAQERIAQALTLRSAAHQARDVHEADRGQHLFVGLDQLHQRRDALVGDAHDADVRLDRAERKLAASALALESELKSVLLPTLGRPTMPQEKPMLGGLLPPAA